jgi:alkanesulfonate monooxygenase SsuD/methylene tetrahydromethanopterin reductase-like flavin-dependent oxidoreductase (luciferase family)
VIPEGRSLDDLVSIWAGLEAAGFDAITVPDHLRPIRGHEGPTYEATALHLLLATTTSSVACGCLVYGAPFRPPGLLAQSLVTIADASGGRAFAGLGAGWWGPDFEHLGLVLGSPGGRSDRLEAVTTDLRRLLGAGASAGDHPAVPVWIAGNGARRTLPTCALLADGWNSPFAGPDAFGESNRHLDRLAEQAGRDPHAITRSVNVRLAWTDEQRAAIEQEMRPGAHAGILHGSTEQVRDRVGEYAAAGADMLVVDVRVPQPLEDLHRFAEEVQLCFDDSEPSGR